MPQIKARFGELSIELLHPVANNIRQGLIHRMRRHPAGGIRQLLVTAPHTTLLTGSATRWVCAQLNRHTS
jgi:hypothetical protein